MTPRVRSLWVAAIHVALVGSLAGKFVYDRATRPRVWAKVRPYDPELFMRGRYLSLQLEVPGNDLLPEEPGQKCFARAHVELRADGDRLGVTASGDPDSPEIRHTCWGQRATVLIEPVAFFISEHASDPSHRQDLWVEVTLPKRGGPRPIRLGIEEPPGVVTPYRDGD